MQDKTPRKSNHTYTKIFGSNVILLISALYTTYCYSILG